MCPSWGYAFPSCLCVGPETWWRSCIQLSFAGSGTDLAPPCFPSCSHQGQKCREATASAGRQLRSASEAVKAITSDTQRISSISTQCSLPVLIPFPSPFFLPSFPSTFISSSHFHSIFTQDNIFCPFPPSTTFSLSFCFSFSLSPPNQLSH